MPLNTMRRTSSSSVEAITLRRLSDTDRLSDDDLDNDSEGEEVGQQLPTISSFQHQRVSGIKSTKTVVIRSFDRNLTVGDRGEEYITLRHRGLGVDEAKVLATYLNHHPGLFVVDVSNNEIGNEGCAALLKALQCSEHRVQFLSLGSNKLTIDAARSIASFIQSDDLVRSLSLSGNENLGDAFLWCLHSVLCLYQTAEGLSQTARKQRWKDCLPPEMRDYNGLKRWRERFPIPSIHVIEGRPTIAAVAAKAAKAAAKQKGKQSGGAKKKPAKGGKGGAKKRGAEPKLPGIEVTFATPAFTKFLRDNGEEGELSSAALSPARRRRSSLGRPSSPTASSPSGRPVSPSRARPGLVNVGKYGLLTDTFTTCLLPGSFVGHKTPYYRIEESQRYKALPPLSPIQAPPTASTTGPPSPPPKNQQPAPVKKKGALAASASGKALPGSASTGSLADSLRSTLQGLKPDQLRAVIENARQDVLSDPLDPDAMEKAVEETRGPWETGQPVHAFTSMDEPPPPLSLDSQLPSFLRSHATAKSLPSASPLTTIVGLRYKPRTRTNNVFRVAGPSQLAAAKLQTTDAADTTLRWKGVTLLSEKAVRGRAKDRSARGNVGDKEGSNATQNAKEGADGNSQAPDLSHLPHSTNAALGSKQIVNRTLRELDISGIGLGGMGGFLIALLLGYLPDKVELVCHNYKNDKPILDLEQRIPPLSSLDASWNPIRETAPYIFKALALPNPFLTSLNLSFCGIDDSIAVTLAAALETNTALIDLDVSHNRLGAAAASAVADALVKNSSLLSLRIGFNPLGYEGTMAIIWALAKNQGLAELYIENTVKGGRMCDSQIHEAWIVASKINAAREKRLDRIELEYPRIRIRSHIEFQERPPDGEEQVKEPWSLANSIFAPRRFECDSKDYYDTGALMKAALKADWEQTKAVKLVPDEAERAKVYAIMDEAYPLLREGFRHYASFSVADPFSISFNVFADFRKDCNLDDPAKLADYDNIFVATNFSMVRSKVNPSHSFMRYEFIEAVLRLALVRYKDERRGSTSEKLSKLLKEHILPNLTAVLDIQNPQELCSNRFREMYLYHEITDTVLKQHRTALTRVYERFSGATRMPGDRKSFMSLQEWMSFLGKFDIIHPRFPERYGKIAFLWSAMTVLDEARRSVADTRRDAHNMHSFVEFLESLARVAYCFQFDSSSNTARSGPSDKTSGDQGAKDTSRSIRSTVSQGGEAPSSVQPSDSAATNGAEAGNNRQEEEGVNDAKAEAEKEEDGLIQSSTENSHSETVMTEGAAAAPVVSTEADIPGLNEDLLVEAPYAVRDGDVLVRPSEGPLPSLEAFAERLDRLCRLITARL